jgi:endoglucanase
VRHGHLDDQKQVDLIDCYVDIGASSKEEAEKMGVQVGDVLTWAGSFQQLNRSLVSGKALDDRLGCSILITLARQLAGQKLPVDLYLMFVVREEVALDAGLPMISSINPDIVIGIDGTLTFDTPDIAGSQSDVFLGKGPVLKWMDAIRGKAATFLPDLELNRSIQLLAERKKIPLQHEVMTGLSTAATPVPYSAQGIRTAALSFPLRYHHTPIECADLGDAEALTDLLLELLRSKDYGL